MNDKEFTVLWCGYEYADRSRYVRFLQVGKTKIAETRDCVVSEAHNPAEFKAISRNCHVRWEN